MSEPVNVFDRLTPDMEMQHMLAALYCIRRTRDATAWPLPITGVDVDQALCDLQLRFGLDPTMTVGEMRRRAAVDVADVAGKIRAEMVSLRRRCYEREQEFGEESAAVTALEGRHFGLGMALMILGEPLDA